MDVNGEVPYLRSKMKKLSSVFCRLDYILLIIILYHVSLYFSIFISVFLR